MQKVSIIVPFFNALPHFRKCLESLISQDYLDIEILLINDGSSDGSDAIAKQFIANDSRIKLFEQKNKGPGAARNLGLDECVGSYICFVDADDFINETMVSDLVKLEQSENAEIIIFKFNKIDFDGVSIESGFGHSVKERKLSGLTSLVEAYRGNISFSPCNKFFKASFLKSKNIRFPELYYNEDRCFIRQCLFESKTIVFSDNAFYTNVQSLKSLTRSVITVNALNDVFKSLEIEQAFFEESKLFKDYKHLMYYANFQVLWAVFKWIINLNVSTERESILESFKKLKSSESIKLFYVSGSYFKLLPKVIVIHLPLLLGWTLTRKLLLLIPIKRLAIKAI